ncbi:MAG: Vgb family protein, partial [Acidiferrobacteraceae bacterium]
KLSPTGTVLGTFTVGTNPIGIAIDQSGNVWIANNGSNNVTKLSPTGTVLGTFTVGTNPIGIAIDQSGNVWIANNGSNNVTKLSPTGTVLGTFAAGAGSRGIAIDQSGNVWISNVNSNNVTKLASNYGVLLPLISQITSYSTLNQTNGLLAGTTAGSVLYFQENQGINKFVAYFNGYENDTTTNQTITFTIPFNFTPIITQNTSGLTVSVTSTVLTITAPDVTTLYSGYVIIEGF